MRAQTVAYIDALHEVRQRFNAAKLRLRCRRHGLTPVDGDRYRPVLDEHGAIVGYRPVAWLTVTSKERDQHGPLFHGWADRARANILNEPAELNRPEAQ